MVIDGFVKWGLCVVVVISSIVVGPSFASVTSFPLFWFC